MQGKVSIVIPCYNKAWCISKMFDSIIAQEWDNIELILVNDGSTDGTREIIAQYEPKFCVRGFEIVIVDQKNQGLPAAVYEGLKRISGDFVCQVDADDELDAKYVSTMAGWLSEHPDYEWAVCDLIKTTNGLASYVHTFPLGEREDCKIEKWMLKKITLASWLYMVRSSYLDYCNVIELYYTGREGSQESQYFFPLVLGGGKIKYFRIPLYKYSYDEPETHHSYLDKGDYDRIVKYYSGWFKTVNETISRLSVDEKEKRRYSKILELSRLITIITYMINNQIYQQERAELLGRLFQLVNSYFSPNMQINVEDANKYPILFFNAIENSILGIRPKHLKAPAGRIVAWGALGKAAANLLPPLTKTSLAPTEFWDAAGDGITVKKPDLDLLGRDDLVIVFPIGRIEVELRKAFAKKPFKVIYNSEIRDWLANELFGEVFHGYSLASQHYDE